MDLSKKQIKSMWTKLTKKISHRAFPATTFINELSTKSEILALFSKTGEDTNQLEQLGFVICTKTIFSASSVNVVSDQGIITNDYFTGEVIDVDNTIIENTFIHLVKVNSGPIVINDIALRLNMNENYHQSLVDNTIGAKLFAKELAKQLNSKISFFNKSIINNEKFIIIANNLKLTRKKILECEAKLNLFLQKQLSLDNLITFQTNKDYSYLTTFNEEELKQIINLEKIAIISIKNTKKQWEIILISGSERIDKFLLEAKKPIVNAIMALNKKIKLINQPEVIKPLSFVANVKSYEDILQLQKIYRKLDKDFKRWRNVSQDLLENLVQTFAFGYYSEVIDSLRVVHYSFNNDLLDYNLMEFKGRKLLTDLNNTILFLSNNISDNPSMIILLSDNLSSKYSLKTIINKLSKKQTTKITYKNDIIIFSTTNYQYVTDFISKIIIIFKSDQFKHYWQLTK